MFRTLNEKLNEKKATAPAKAVKLAPKKPSKKGK